MPGTGAGVCTNDLRPVAVLAMCAGSDRAFGDADGGPGCHAAIHGPANGSDDGTAATHVLPATGSDVLPATANVLPATANVLPATDGRHLLPRAELCLSTDLVLPIAVLNGCLLRTNGRRLQLLRILRRRLPLVRRVWRMRWLGRGGVEPPRERRPAPP